MAYDPSSEYWRELLPDLERQAQKTASVKAELGAISHTSDEMPLSLSEVESVLVDNLHVLTDQMTLMIEAADRVGKPFREVVGDEAADKMLRECSEAIDGFTALKPGLSVAAVARGEAAVAQMERNMQEIGAAASD